MNERTFKSLLKVAAEVAEAAADPTGFVSVSNLAKQVCADVKFRPLLVEGIAAEPKSKNGRWLVLIDSETHAVTADMFDQETSTAPLGSRLRNTLAHELAHTLGNRMGDQRSDVSRVELVELLERETEQISPVLLVPPSRLEKFLSSDEFPLQIEDLVAERDRLAISSKVFCSRFELIRFEENGALLHHPRLLNVAMGTGEWLSASRAELHAKPFSGFRGLVPEFLAQLRDYRKILVDEHFPAQEFYLNGGSDERSQNVVWMGTTKIPHAEKALLELFVERVPRKSGVGFLWLARLAGEA